MTHCVEHGLCFCCISRHLFNEATVLPFVRLEESDRTTCTQCFLIILSSGKFPERTGLQYYYRGCVSWGWFFPYHYGPMISDLTDLVRVFDKIKFEVGEPLRPFQQLMGCLPPASAKLVPSSCQARAKVVPEAHVFNGLANQGHLSR